MKSLTYNEPEERDMVMSVAFKLIARFAEDPAFLVTWPEAET